jgi:anti-sigma-K factor RskA
VSDHAGGAEHDERWPDEVAAYLLGALDPQELEAFEHHLISCPVCRDDVSALTVVVDSLPAAVTPVGAPADLKQRIMTTVRAEAELLAAAGAPADRAVRAGPRRRLPSFGLRAAAALSAGGALAAGLVIGGLAFSGQGGAATHIQAASVDATAEPEAAAQVQRRGSDVSLVVDHLAPPPQGRVYELWLKRPGQAPQANALFSLSSGSVAVHGDLRGVQTLLVTAEPVGGSRAPTGQPVIAGKLA